MRTRRITDTERRRIRRTLPMRDRLITDIAYQTGLRISDILALPADLNSTKITITEQKTDNVRTVHIRQKTLDECRKYAVTHSKNGLLFDVNRSTVYRSIHAAALHCGYQHISAHSYRKAFAYAYYQKHGLRATQIELGHKHIETTCIYVFDLEEYKR